MEFPEIVKQIEAAFPEAAVSTDDTARCVLIAPEHWQAVAEYLKTDPGTAFDVLMCLTGYDQGPEKPLGVAYNLQSMEHRHKLEVRIETPRDNSVIPSVAHLWRTADWHEREAYDLFGVTFEGHPDLRRMLLPDDWEGHPLRKDYQTPDFYHGIPIPKDKRGWE